MERTIRWGILGTGGISRAFAQALRETPGAQLVAVGSRSVGSARAFAEAFGAAAYASYAALVAAPEVDIVYIGTPHTLHAENTVLALEAGKAVLCEKPFAMNLRQARRMVDLARSRKLFLMEAMWTRFMPALAEVRRLVASGEIGEVALVQADFGFAATRDPAHRVNQHALGGGALLDLGIYPLSIASALLGPVESVCAQAMIGDTGVDITTGFSLRHRGGTVSVCSCSLRARTPCELSISGSRGSIRMDSLFHMARSLTITGLDGASRSVATPFLGNGYVHEALAAGEALRAGLIEHPAMTHEDTLAGMRVLDDIRAQIGLRYPADDDHRDTSPLGPPVQADAGNGDTWPARSSFGSPSVA